MPLLGAIRRTMARARTSPFCISSSMLIVLPMGGGSGVWMKTPPRLRVSNRETERRLPVSHATKRPFGDLTRGCRRVFFGVVSTIAFHRGRISGKRPSIILQVPVGPFLSYYLRYLKQERIDSPKRPRIREPFFATPILLECRVCRARRSRLVVVNHPGLVRIKAAPSGRAAR